MALLKAFSGGVRWSKHLLISKNFPTDPWSIPQTPWPNSLWFGIPESFGGDFGDVWGMRNLTGVCWGEPLRFIRYDWKTRKNGEYDAQLLCLFGYPCRSLMAQSEKIFQLLSFDLLGFFGVFLYQVVTLPKKMTFLPVWSLCYGRKCRKKTQLFEQKKPLTFFSISLRHRTDCYYLGRYQIREISRNSECPHFFNHLLTSFKNHIVCCPHR